MTTAVLFGLILSVELWLPLLEEIALLVFEWVEKTVDLFYETVAGLDAYGAQKAGAWTLLAMGIGLASWLGYLLRLKYLQAKAAAPQWWAEQKAAWAELPWYLKLAYIAGGSLMLGVLAMFI